MPAWMGRKLEDFGALWPAEKRVAVEMGDGMPVWISPDVPPEDAPHEHQLRASFVRYLALGGCAKLRPPDKGLQIAGASIFGDGPDEAETQGLDLQGTSLTSDLVLAYCRFQHSVVLLGCSGQTFNFQGSTFATVLSADGLTATGNVFLHQIKTTGEVRLLGAALGGALSCNGATFAAVQDRDGNWGFAFGADGLTTMGSVFLHQIKATGEVRFLGAEIGGGLECDGATFAAVQDRDGNWGDALNLQDVTVKNGFFWRAGARADGMLNLNRARFGVICDAAECWPEPGNLDLDQCRYDAFVSAPADATLRLRWLALQRKLSLGEFNPQPYEQCAKVLRAMGHAADARTVLIEKERLQRRARRTSIWPLFRLIWWLKDQTLNVTVRYGRQPLLAFAWLAIVWSAGTLVFLRAADEQTLKPNAVYVLRAPEWVRCGYSQGELRPPSAGEAMLPGLATANQTQFDCYLVRDEARNYPVFTPWVYSADTLLPIVDLEMQTFWIPDESKPFGKYARWYLWFQIFAGWALSLLAVAGFSGLIKTDNTT